MALRTLYQSLMDNDVARLRVIARQWDIELLAERRADVVAELADAMARAEAVNRSWENLAPEPRAALEDLLRREGAEPWAAFVRRWGHVRTVGPGRLEREELWKDPVSPAEALWYWGFLHRAPQIMESGTSVQMAFVPESLALYLPTPPPLEIPPPETTAPPLRIRAYGDRIVEEVVTLLSYVQNSEVLVTEEGAWPSAHQRRLSRWLRVDQTPLPFLQAVVCTAGLAQRDERGHLKPVPEATLDWLRSDRWTQWETLVRGWLNTSRWNDMTLLETVRPDVTGWPNDPARTRENVLALLEQCTLGVWYPLAGFVAYVQEYEPDFLRPNADYDSWSLRDARSGAPLRGFEAWEAVEGVLLAALLVESLTWLGLVDVGRHNPRLPVDSFRLSDLGAAFLELGKPPTFSEAPSVRLRDDGLLTVPVGRRYERFQLSRIARPWTLEDEEAYGYRLTPRSLRRARRQRISLSRIAEFLEEATEQALPEPLLTALRTAYEEGGRGRVVRLWVLRVHDPEVLAAENIQGLLHESLGPGVATVQDENLKALLVALTQAGVLPEVVRAALHDR